MRLTASAVDKLGVGHRDTFNEWTRTSDNSEVYDQELR